MLRLAGKKMNSKFSTIDSHHFGPNKRKHNKPTTKPIILCIILKSETAQKWNVAFASNSKTNLKLSFLNFWKRWKENIAKFKINAYLGTHQKKIVKRKSSSSPPPRIQCSLIFLTFLGYQTITKRPEEKGMRVK